MHQYDFLVLGSGVAGLTYAIKVAERFPNGKVAIITKADESESNTKYAQGGIAVVLDELTDSFEQHVQDTLRAGDGLCDEEVVRIVVTEGPERLAELINWGTSFDENKEGSYDLGREGGHTYHRILHHKDITGKEIETKLLQQVHKLENITVLSEHFAIDLITQHHLQSRKSDDPVQCFGAYVLNKQTGKIETCLAKATMLATGGAGQVYQNTTNPIIATGDGVAMAYRAKARIEGVEFIQFHPTALFDHGASSPSFLISEAVRGFGAHLRNKRGERFMVKYDERYELASRDIVSRAIDSEMKKSGDECVYLDCRHLDMEAFKGHFPNILEKCESMGLDLTKDLIPVVPAAHYICGGIKTDIHGQTTVKNLFACGECAHTGLHGGNRLASNSLLEALVFAHRCYETSRELIDTEVPLDIPEWNEEGTSQPDELILITHNRKELQTMMSDYVGIIRSDERLKRALNRLKVMHEENEDLYKRTKISPQLSELRNMISVAYLIVQHSLNRKENAGAFFRA